MSDRSLAQQKQELGRLISSSNYSHTHPAPTSDARKAGKLADKIAELTLLNNAANDGGISKSKPGGGRAAAAAAVKSSADATRYCENDRHDRYRGPNVVNDVPVTAEVRSAVSDANRGRSPGTPARREEQVHATPISSRAETAAAVRHPPQGRSWVPPRRRDDVIAELQDRLKATALQPKEVNRNSAFVNKIRDKLCDFLKSRYPISFHWHFSSTGSHYEKTKIMAPDEYDIMLICKIRAKPIYTTPKDSSQLYCSLELPTACNWEPAELISLSGDRRYVCPKAYMMHFREQVIEFVNRHYRSRAIVVRPSNGKSPAVTLDVTKRSKPFSVDIVPSVKLLSWPQPAKDWTSAWLPQDVVYKITHPDESGDSFPYVLAVTKIHTEEDHLLPGNCKLWRLSFSAVEKEIMLHADGQYSRTDNTCRKKIFKLLKDDLRLFNENNWHHNFTSHFLKNIAMRLYEESPKEWSDEFLPERYVDGLEGVTFGLESRFIPSYFMPDVNLLDISVVSQALLTQLKQYFRSRADYYANYK